MSIKNKQNSSVNFLVTAEFLTELARLWRSLYPTALMAEG